ncbi:MAG: O-antigen ligase family protein [Anaerolineae bacterium]
MVFAVGLLAIISFQNQRWRRIALALIAVFCVVELVIVSGIFAPPTLQPEIAERDETSFSQRLVIWGAAVNIIRDYPLTGVGLNQFRSQRVRENYPVPDFAMRVVPHAHDELLQVGADTGIPGMILFVIWHAGLVVMIWRGDGDRR